MDPIQFFYPESRFGGFTDIDGTIAFYSRVNALIAPSSIVLDIGCGRGAYSNDPVPYRRNLRVLKGKCKRVIGIDVDEKAESNPFLDEFRLLKGPQWPVTDGSFDLCLSDSVLEHITDPKAFFCECRRILKPGGHLCIRTPNVFSYFGLASFLIPNRLHGKFVAGILRKRREEDVFPTLYRCNTRGKIKRMLKRHGFSASVKCFESEPTYLSFSWITYFFGVLHQRFAPQALRPAIFAFARKET